MINSLINTVILLKLDNHLAWIFCAFAENTSNVFVEPWLREANEYLKSAQDTSAED